MSNENLKKIESIFNEHQKTIQKLTLLIPQISEIASLIKKTLHSGGKVLIFGNGGSASDSQHIAAEIVGRFVKERKGLPAIALTTDTSIITAVANDYGYEHIFSRQIEALCLKNDVVIGISTSGQWALVVGDLMLDRYLIGSVSRISPEAPVPVVRLKESFDRIGGSGNVAANLAQLGIKTILAGQIGDDGDGKKLLDILKKNHIGVDGIVKDKNPTTTKTRIIGEHQQMMRIDQEATADLIDSKPLIKRISTLLNKKPKYELFNAPSKIKKIS